MCEKMHVYYNLYVRISRMAMNMFKQLENESSCLSTVIVFIYCAQSTVSWLMLMTSLTTPKRLTLMFEKYIYTEM